MRAATFFDGEGWREGTVDLVGGEITLNDFLPSPVPPSPDLHSHDETSCISFSRIS